jgi:hypothetical protein
MLGKRERWETFTAKDRERGAFRSKFHSKSSVALDFDKNSIT